MHLVMLALPFVLRGLISSVIADISKIIDLSVPGDRLHGIALPVDPTDSILEALNTFMVWYLTIRTPVLGLDGVVESHHMAVELVECLKRVFPERDGKESGWKLGKLHDVMHVAQIIALFGWTQNTSGDWGEHGHKELLKCLVGLINNKDIFMQFAQWHHKAGLLQQELQADSDLPEAISKENLNAACELAVKYPLLHAAVHFKDLQYFKGSLGKHGSGRYSLDVWSLPADRDPQLPLVEQHPILRELPTALGVFAYEFLQKQMGLDQVDNPTVEQANDVLVNCMPDPMLCTFGCLCMKLPGCPSVSKYPEDTFLSVWPR